MSKNIDTEEKQRIKRILSGRSDEYAYFVKTYSGQVLDFVNRMVCDTSDAEELAQDAFVRAFRSLGQFDGRSSWLTWVLRIAFHTTLSHLKRQRPQWLSIEDLPLADTTDEEFNTGREERIRLLETSIDTLPPNEQMLLHLYYYDDRPLRDIAYIMDTEPGVLATRLHRIRKKLLQMMKENER